MNYTTIQKIIRKHYGKRKTKNLNWESCGREIEELIKSKEKMIEIKNLGYYSEVGEKNMIRKILQDEYESYFKVLWGFDWIYGNRALKKLVKDLVK